MRVLICASGTTGDVYPLVGIAAAMKQRGHEVFLLANPAYEALANEAGLYFRGIGKAEDLAALKSHPQAWSYSKGWQVWLRGAGVAPMRELYGAIDELNIDGNTIVGAAYLCLGARVAQENLGIPTATLHLNVHTIRSIHNIHALPPPSFLPDWLPNFYVFPKGSPAWYRRTTIRIVDHFFFDPVLRGEVVRFREELGLPPLTEFVREWWNSPDSAIGMFPEWWAEEHPDWPEQVVTTGFPFWDRSDSLQLSDDLHDFVSANGKVLVFSPGASSGHSPTHFEAYQQACRELGYRGLVLTPNAPESHAEHMRFEKFVPFTKLLPHAAAVVHHAGIGTSAQCLSAGVPQVVVPTLYNQPDTAIRLMRLGVAARVQPWKFGLNRLTAALRRVLDSGETAGSCEQWATKLGKGDPLSDICSHLESLVP